MATPARPSRLRRRRQEAGLTQAELAERAGVSRQLVAAVEAGQNAPAVDAALGLARALSSTVEDLFAPAPTSVRPALGKVLHDRTPLRIGRVGDQLVASELPDRGTAGPSWASSDGVLEDGILRLFPGATPAGLVLAGCDPALGIAETALSGLGPASLLAVSASTGSALGALGRGLLHGAVVHGPSDRLPRAPVPVLRIHLARWRVGLATAPKLSGWSLGALVASRITIAQRDAAAASQQALEHALTRAGLATPPGPQAGGHIDAARTAALLQCAAVTTESAATTFDLDFAPLEEHTVEVWLDRRWTEDPPAEALTNLLASRAFTDRVAQFGGYDLTGCGTTVS